MYKMGIHTGVVKGYCNSNLSTQNVKEITTIFAVVIAIGFFVMPIQVAEAGPPPITIDWSFPLGYSIDSGDALGATLPVTFTVHDPALAGNGIDTIDVMITSSVGGSTTLTLTESVDNGMFTNTNLIFTHGPDEFSVTDTTTITIEDNCMFGTGNCDPNVIDILTAGVDGAFIVSNTSFPSFIEIDLTETGKNTGIFTRVLSFSTVASDPATATLLVSPGDVISIVDEVTSKWVNALIIPSPSDIGSIPAVILGTVTASYGGVSTPVLIQDDGAPGRGGGGLLRPGLVLNFIGSSSGSLRCSGGDCTAPILGIDSLGNRLVDKGFSYNGFAEDVLEYYTPYPLITTNVGQENVAVLKIYDNGGPKNIKHVSLAFGLSHGRQSISQSQAVIIWDKNFFGYETVKVKDPNNALQDVSVETTTGSCSIDMELQCLIVLIHHTFRESLDFNIVGTDVWDFKRNSKTNFYNDGIEIVGESMNPPKQYYVLDSLGYQFLITQTGKNTATDDDGNTWTYFKNKWLKDYVPQEKIPDVVTFHGISRNNNMFNAYVEGQKLLAQELFNQQFSGKSIQNPDFYVEDNFVFLPSNFNLDEYEKQLEQRILDEQTLAEGLFSKLYRVNPNS